MAVLASASPRARRQSLNRGQVEGEVLQVFPSVIVIKNEQGQAPQLMPRTQVSGP